MIPARGYGMLTFTRKNRLAAFVGPPVAVRETLASLDRIHAHLLRPAFVQVRLPADDRLAVRTN